MEFTDRKDIKGNHLVSRGDQKVGGGGAGGAAWELACFLLTTLPTVEGARLLIQPL